MSKGIVAGFAILSLALTLTITTGSGAAQKGNGCSPPAWVESVQRQPRAAYVRANPESINLLWLRAAEPSTERT